MSRSATHSRRAGSESLENRLEGVSLQITDIDRWGVPLLSILGVLGLATWSIYWDLRRRLPRHPPPGSSAFPAKSGKAVPGRGYLEGAVVALAAAWLMRYLSVRWGAWLGLAGYGAFVAGITLLAMHVARRLSDLQRDPEGE